MLVSLVLLLRLARVGPHRGNDRQAYRAQETLRPLSLDSLSTTPKVHHHIAAAIEGAISALLVDKALELHIDLNDN